MGVKLEVFRMTLYLTFPVAMFWIANQAEWFEDYVIQRKRELWPPEKEDQPQVIDVEVMSCSSTAVFISRGCLNKVLPTGWLRATDIYCHTLLEV
uniref:PET100 cytochrome c oxidase chaperone n=1 Tax=Equus caballus TaxID=9796 RepID=A0A9L0T6C2_HORSE